MATQNPALPPGQWVQFNSAVQDPRAPKPSSEEQGIGQIRQSFSKSDGQYYQVVWNPGQAKPKSGLYHEDQLCALDQKSAQDIVNQMNAGTYQPNPGAPGSEFQQPPVDIAALPPQNQPVGMESL